VVDTAPGVLRLAGPRVRVEVSGATGPVFLGIARAAEVESYLADVRRTQVVGLRDGETLITRGSGAKESLPDPAVADLWTARATGTGAAALAWTDQPGEWRLVAAADGRSVAPSELRFTWTGGKFSNPAPALISLGVLLLVAGVVGLVLLWVRAREEAELL
jgi:hypothetical protein